MSDLMIISQGDNITTNVNYLWRHAAPEVRVGGSGLQHGSYNSFVLTHQLPQHVLIGEQVVAVDHLQMDTEDTSHSQTGATEATVSVIVPQRARLITVLQVLPAPSSPASSQPRDFNTPIQSTTLLLAGGGFLLWYD